MKILLLLLLVVSSFSFAEEEMKKSRKQSIQPALGFGRGGLIIGADYERKHKKLGGYGAYLRHYQDDDDIFQPSITTVGAFVRPHFKKGVWDLNLTFGLGLNNVNGVGNQEDETAIGGVWGVGLAYRTKGNISFAVENFEVFGVLASDYKGILADDLIFKIIIEI